MDSLRAVTVEPGSLWDGGACAFCTPVFEKSLPLRTVFRPMFASMPSAAALKANGKPQSLKLQSQSPNAAAIPKSTLDAFLS